MAKKKIKVVARYSKPGDGGLDDEPPVDDEQDVTWDAADAVAAARDRADQIEESVRSETARADRAEGELAATLILLEQVEANQRDDLEVSELDARVARLKRERADLSAVRVDLDALVRRRAEIRRLAYDALESELGIDLLEELSDRDLMVSAIDLAGIDVDVSQGRSDAYVEAMFRSVIRRDGGEWDEDKHPRGEHGKFGDGGGGGGGGERSTGKSSTSKSVTHESISREQIKAVEARAIADKNTGLRDAARTALESGSSSGQKAALDRVVAHVNSGGQEHLSGGNHSAETVTHEQIKAVEAQAIADGDTSLRDAARTAHDSEALGRDYAKAIDKVVTHLNGGTSGGRRTGTDVVVGKDSPSLGLDKGTKATVVRVNHEAGTMDIVVPSHDMTIAQVELNHPDLHDADKVPHPRAERAAQLTASADAASAKANASGSKRDHDAAANLHGQALSEHRALGTGGSRYHGEQYYQHATKGSGIAKHEAAANTSHDAELASDIGSHAEAATAHAAAARAATTVGATDLAKYHEGRAAEHGKSAGADARTSTQASKGAPKTGADKAAEATRIARERQAALKDRLAKANQRGGRGRKKRGDADWEEDKHPRANDGKFGSGDGGGGSEPKVTERAAASVKNSDFVGKHRDRLIAAADAYRNSLPAEVSRGSDEVHNRAQQEIHHEAERIHREQDAMAGPHAERLQRAVDNLVHDKTSTPDAKHETALKAIADEHKVIADEHAAIAAGHVDVIHEDKLNEFKAGKAEFEHEVGKMSTDLHEQQQAALTAVADFEAVHEATVDPGESSGESVIDANMHDAYDSASHTLDDALGGKGRELNTDPTREYEQLEHVEKPDKSDDPGKWDEKKVIEDNGYSSEEIADGAVERAKAEHDDAVNSYQEGVAAYEHFQRELKAREAAVKPAAVKAQTALEELHANQVASLARAMELDGKASSGFDAISKELENVGVKEDAFDHHAQHEDGTFTDPKVQADYERAHAAASSLRSEYDQQIESTRYGFEEDSLSSLRDAIKETAAAAKQLSKYTGRQPTLEKATKARARKK